MKGGECPLNGWINLERKLTEHWLWDDKPFSFGQAWIDLIFLAGYEKRQVIHGDKVITLNPGELIATDRYLMQRWGWGNTRLRRFFKLLEDSTMVEKKSNQNQIIISLCNYSLYQMSQIKSKSKPNQNQITPYTVDINIKDYNNKKINNNIYTRARAREKENQSLKFDQRSYTEDEINAIERKKLGIPSKEENNE